MKFGAPLTLLRFVVAFATTQQVLPLFALAEHGKQKEVKPKIRFTAAELTGLVPLHGRKTGVAEGIGIGTS